MRSIDPARARNLFVWRIAHYAPLLPVAPRAVKLTAAFWQVVASACPDYLKLRRELKSYAL